MWVAIERRRSWTTQGARNLALALGLVLVALTLLVSALALGWAALPPPTREGTPEPRRGGGKTPRPASEPGHLGDQTTVTRRVALALVALAAFCTGALAGERFIVVAPTTSTHDSGLFGHILPLFTARTGIEVKVVTQGTGQALDTARRGDADVVPVHARAQEERFVAEGFGVGRRDVMHNDFALVGTDTDPAGVRGLRDATAALRRIAEANAPFVSRGDGSGTHAAELAWWKAAFLDPSKESGNWYREVGQGTGPALNIAAASGAYLLANRGTWLSFRNRRGLAVVVEGDPRLLNPYGIILVNPARHPHVRREEGPAFIDWLTGPEERAAMAGSGIEGEQLFIPTALEAGQL